MLVDPPCAPHCLLFDILSQGLNSQAASQPLCLMSPTGFEGGAGRFGGGARGLPSEQPTCRDAEGWGRGIKHDPPEFVCLSCLSSLAVGRGEAGERGFMSAAVNGVNCTRICFTPASPRGATARLPARLHVRQTHAGGFDTAGLRFTSVEKSVANPGGGHYNVPSMTSQRADFRACMK